MRPAWIGIIILVVAAAFLLIGYATGFLGQVAGAEAARFTGLFALLIVFLTSAMAARDMTLSKALRHSAVWLAIGIALVIVYTWLDDIAALLGPPG